jgi:hypothetical protein
MIIGVSPASMAFRFHFSRHVQKSFSEVSSYEKIIDSVKSSFRRARVIVGAAVLAAGIQSVTAQSIGCNFVYSGAGGYKVGAGGIDNREGDSLRPTDMAGAPTFAQMNWNNLSEYGSGVTLTNSAGVATTLTIQWNAPNIASSGTAAGLGTPDGKLMDGFLQTGWPNLTTLNVSGYTNVLSIPQSAGAPMAYVGGLQSWYLAQGAVSYAVVIYQTAGTCNPNNRGVTLPPTQQRTTLNP